METALLKDVLQLLLPSVDTKGLVKEFMFLNFSGKYVEATDGNLLTRVELSEETDSFCVSADVFSDLIKTIDNKEIKLTIMKDKKTDQEKLVINSEKFEASLLLPKELKFPKLDFDIKDDVWKDVPDELLKALSLCKFTACPDQTSGPLTGVCVKYDRVLSCDRFRITSVKLGQEIDGILIFPISLINQIEKYESQIDGYYLQEDTIYFRVDKGKAIIGSKLIHGEYPFEKIYDSVNLTSEKGPWNLITLTDQMKIDITKAVTRQNVIQNNIVEFDREMRCEVSSEEMKLFSEDQSIGYTYEKIRMGKALSKDTKFEFVINPVFLLKMFAEASTLGFSKVYASCSFTGDKFTHMIKTKSDIKKEKDD